MNIEASEPQSPPLLSQWIVSQDGKQAVGNMVKCLGFALRGEQWNHVSFSPHSVVCPLYNLTRCFPACDLCLDNFKVVSYISHLIKESQRFSHWKENMSVAFKIFENFASSLVSFLGGSVRCIFLVLPHVGAHFSACEAIEILCLWFLATPTTNHSQDGCEQTWQRLMRAHCMQLLQDIAVNSHSCSCTWFPRSPSPEDQVAIRRIKVQAAKLCKQLLVLPIAACMGQVTS